MSVWLYLFMEKVALQDELTAVSFTLNNLVQHKQKAATLQETVF